MNDFVLLGTLGLLLISGCVLQHPANRPGGEKYVFEKDFCEKQNGIFSYASGWENDNYCDIIQTDKKYKRYLIHDISETDYPDWILVEGPNYE